MRQVQFLTMVTILLTAGCGAPPDGAPSDDVGQNDPDSTAARSDTFTETQTPDARGPFEDESNVTVYKTGDVAFWPTLAPPPMLIEFNLPEVPEQIKGPFTENDPPTVE